MNDDLLQLWPRIEQILDDLLELPEPERSARAAAACGGDPQLQRAVESLLAAERSSERFLSTPAHAVLTADEAAATGSSWLGTRVGAYRLVEELGRGGMGIVFRAERVDGEFTQQVAIKLLDTGTRVPATVDRFRREREILAHLQHPNIARLYDGGILADGTPYLAMELADGMRIDEHCRVAQLGSEARVRLFLAVCRAVEYAHGRLIVHRDLKPANVLVAPDGSPKLLDFGIARWLEESERTDPTLTVARVMTPAYAAPEQLRGEPITVATDIYQLGLLLYELLSGRRAHGDPPSSPAAMIDAALHGDPLPPSHAAGSERIARQTADDLDAIVLKALRKLPTERYPTVEALRRDLEAVLEHRPVAARRGSALYRARKLLRRHRVPFTAASAAAASLAIGVVAVVAQARATGQERDRAQLAEARAAAINDFLLNELLAAATPEKSLGKDRSVGEVLAIASRTVGPAFHAVPQTEGDVRLALAKSYVALGNYPQARQHAEAAAARFEHAGPVDRLRATRQLAELTLLDGDLTAARAAADRSVEEHLAALGEQHPDTLRAQLLAARVAIQEGKPALAAEQLLTLLPSADRSADDEWRLAVEIREALIDAYAKSYRAEPASELADEVLSIVRQRLGEDHPTTLGALRRLASARMAELRAHDALPLYQEVLTRRLATAGPDHPDTADAYNDVATAHDRLGQGELAGLAVEKAYAIYARALGQEHPRTIRALRNRAVLASRARRFDQAEPAYDEVLAVRTRLLGPLHPSTIQTRIDLLQMFMRAARSADARRQAREIVAAFEQVVAKPDVDPTVLDEYARLLLEVEPAEFRDPHRALTLAERAVGLTARREHLTLDTLARAQRALGNAELALAAAQESLATPEAIRSWSTEALLVELMTAHRSPAELERFLLDRIEQMRQQRGPDDPYLAKTLRHLAQLYQRTGRHAEAEQRFAEALQQLRKVRPEPHWEVSRAKGELGEALLRRGARAEAEPLLRSAYEALAADPTTEPQTLAQARERVEALDHRPPPPS